jgi:site-specific recombinase XerD
MQKRLIFHVDKKDFSLREKVKGIDQRRWHPGQKKWSIPYNEPNTRFLKTNNLSYSIQAIAMSPKPPKKELPEPLIPFKALAGETKQKMIEMKQWMEQRRYSYSTIKTYLSFVQKFFVHYYEKHWYSITEKDIVEYNHKAFVLTKLSFSAHNQFINAIKLFYTIHKSDSLFPKDLQRPIKNTRLPNVLSKQEVERIISSTGNLKHRCLLIVIYGAGLRIGEALRLRIEDVRSQENLLYIRQSKGAKDRRVPLSVMMLRILREYFKAYRPSHYLFEGQKGGKYSPTSSRAVLKKACKKAGIRIKVTLHTLRHSYATHLMESGVGLRYIQEILGHESPKTTMLYTRISGKRLSEIRSPLEDMDL